MKIKSIKFSDDELALRIFIATGGYHDYVMSIIKDAIQYAFEEEVADLSIKHLEKAWNTDITAYVRLSETNPFTMSINSLKKFLI